MEIRHKINVEAVRSRAVTGMPYPHIRVNDVNSCLPLVVECLEEGDMPVIATWNGNTKIIKKISFTARNVNRLMRVTELDMVEKEDVVKPLRTVNDFMEVVLGWI